MATSGNRDGPQAKNRSRPISEPTATPYQTEENPAAENSAAVHLHNNGDNSAVQRTGLTTINESNVQYQDATTADDPPDANERPNGNGPDITEPKHGKRSRKRPRIPRSTPLPNPKGRKKVTKPMQRPMVEPDDPLLGAQEVVRWVGMNLSSIYVQVRLGNFPAPIKVSKKSIRWKSSEIKAWIESRPRATGEVGNWRLKKRR